VYLLSGLYFPLRTLGAIAGVAASLLPLGLGLDALRQLLLHGTPMFIPVGLEVIAIAAQTLVFAIASWRLLTFIEHRARLEGRLVTRWN
jgi:ABC-2 type transport system permease protein